MTGRVYLYGSLGLKPVREEDRGGASRGRALYARGVRTPDPLWLAWRRAVGTRWIEGDSGREIVQREWPRAIGGRDRAVRLMLESLMRSLTGLHEADAEDIEVPPLDRRRHVDRRLASCPNAFLVEAAHMLLDRADPDPEGPGFRRGIVHGDCHVGQFVFPRGGADPWIVDLEDLARGPTEHDIGNLIAHLATCQPRLTGCDSLLLARTWTIEAAERSGHPALSLPAVHDHIAVALVRRALKLSERDPAWDPRAVLDMAAAVV